MKYTHIEKWTDGCFAFMSKFRYNSDDEPIIVAITRFSELNYSIEWKNIEDKNEIAEVAKTVIMQFHVWIGA